jgi:hypothetical protein
MGGRQAMRSTIVILILCGLILLVFSPVWYPALTGEDEDISDRPLDASQAEAVIFAS